MSSFLTKIFEQIPRADEAVNAIRSGERIDISGLVEPAIAGFADFLSGKFQVPIILIVPTESYDSIIPDIQTSAGLRASNFPNWDVLPYEHKYPSAEIVAERISTLFNLISQKSPVILTTPSASMWRTLPQNYLISHTLELKLGQQISQEKLTNFLVNSGYRREQLVEYLQTFARRGEIIDFFSPAYSDAVRIEFFGDRIDEMRLFSTRDQRSIRKIESVTILPAIEWLSMEEPDTDELLSRISPEAKKFLSKHQLEEVSARIALDRHFPGEIWFAPIFEPKPIPAMDIFAGAGENKPIIITLEPEFCEDEIKKFYEHAQNLYHRTQWENFSPLPPENIFPEPDKFFDIISNSQVKIRQIPITLQDIDFGVRGISKQEKPIAILESMENAQNKGEIYLAVASDSQAKRIAQKLGGAIPIATRHGAISTSFSVETKNGAITILSGDEILGFSRSLFIPQKYHTGKAMLAHYGLEQGDLIVHSEYGIARFMGIKTMEIQKRKVDFLQLEFAEDEKLYVPMENFYLVNPYIGPRDIAKLSKLHGKKWSSAKLRASKKVFELAGELVRIYAMRQVKSRPKFEPAPEWEQIVIENFPFEETADQMQTIQNVLSDMNSEHPMDRLICGDVGFGKTEVALRASVRAIASGVQVALLVPTTILAVQHYETFSQRLAELPINVAMLSRFVSPKKSAKIIAELADGKVDIVIGTHKLLSDKFKFKNLGFLIIDEEQWFGVKHKEKLKSFRAEVDVLTMTATPIPRTLYFSISGVRDLSIIETAPKARKPVFTHIIPWNIDVFTKAIYQEIERGGQVFFIHNRVQTIDGIASQLKKFMPDLKFAVAHGRMPERKLEKVVLDFRDGKYDVLVCTAIIESGTDMPRVNTIIIDRADRFGLSQLYQLRGRVGRADMQAYAYLVIPPYRSMTALARKRLRAIMEHSDLGSGYHLALKDMEIRGAGNLLGKEQSGFVDEIGLDLYTKMLAEAVAELKGQKPPIFEPIPFSLDFDAYISSDYIPDTENRIWAYQRLFTADKVEKIDRIEQELADRFGKIPTETQNIIRFLRARILATRARFDSVSFGSKWISLSFDTEKIAIAELDRKLKKFEPPPDFVLPPSPKLRLPRTAELKIDLRNLVKMLKKLN
ncbi:transcription-repair coupling factor [bacterium]|nr:transcription-repair coupling factor [bacterium]